MECGQLLAAAGGRAEDAYLLDHAVGNARRRGAPAAAPPGVAHGVHLVDEAAAPPLLAVEGQVAEERQVVTRRGTGPFQVVGDERGNAEDAPDLVRAAARGGRGVSGCLQQAGQIGQRGQERHDAVRQFAADGRAFDRDRAHVHGHRVSTLLRAVEAAERLAAEQRGQRGDVGTHVFARAFHADAERFEQRPVAHAEPKGHAAVRQLGNRDGRHAGQERVAEIDVGDVRADRDARRGEADGFGTGQRVAAALVDEDRIEAAVFRLAAEFDQFGGRGFGRGRKDDAEWVHVGCLFRGWRGLARTG